jgi:hypothetical protein
LTNISPIEKAAVEVVDESAQFFAPVSSDIFNELLGQYQAMRKRLEALAEMMSGETAGAVSYFIDGNQDTYSRYSPSVEKLFNLKGGIAALNAAYWSKTLALTDVLDMMPQKRRDEWNKTIREMTAPDFTEEAVRPTITELLNMRAQFLAERVDGIFRGLSGEHVTNAPEGFGKRMIFSGVLGHGSVYHNPRGLVSDLRCVVAKFMGRDEPKYSASDALIEALKGNWGKWVTIDGSALRIRLYMKGTAHLEVHPDMAWRLNSILANLHPLVIPAEFRQRPAKKAKTFTMMGRPLPFAVLEILHSMCLVREFVGEKRFDSKAVTVPNARQFGYQDRDKAATAEAARVLMSIGGAQVSPGVFHFDYEPAEVLSEIITSGCIPDQKAHQFYPTPESLARIAVDLADIGDGHTVLELSAGMGGLADLLPKERTECVEISALHCKVLESKCYRTQQADFLDWKAGTFNRIVMNPPFSEGRWQAHTQHAASMLHDQGVLVAILPASARKRFTLPGLACEWHGPYDNEFSGTGVSVVILKATRGAS